MRHSLFPSFNRDLEYTSSASTLSGIHHQTMFPPPLPPIFSNAAGAPHPVPYQEHGHPPPPQPPHEQHHQGQGSSIQSRGYPQQSNHPNHPNHPLSSQDSLEHPTQLQHHHPHPPHHPHSHPHSHPQPPQPHHHPVPVQIQHQQSGHLQGHPPPPTRHSISHPSNRSSSISGGSDYTASGAGVLSSVSKVDEASGLKYQLDVVQQPIRARMCGFGDKDRRPITPPPCIRLIITDIATGKEVDVNNLDPLKFVLNVDLWDEHGRREVNLVRSATNTTNAASAAASIAHNFSNHSVHGPDSTGASQYGSQSGVPLTRDGSFNSSNSLSYSPNYQSQSGYPPPGPPQYHQPGTYQPPQQVYYAPHSSYRADPNIPLQPYSRDGSVSSGGHGHEYHPSASSSRASGASGQPQGMSSRNLIGNVAVSAFRLTDNENKPGVWFVLQDLSVRVEGPFRLRFSAVNVGPPGGASRDGSGPQVNTGRIPILASCFSESFTVFSAKKFPGVCESTPLSKTFAAQGIKIPIRKDGAAKGEDDDDYGE